MYTDNTLFGPRNPKNADMEYVVKLLRDKADKRHNHTKEDILEFMNHNHDERYYRLDQHQLKLWYAGEGNPDFQVGEQGDFYVDTLNGILYIKNKTYWEPQMSIIGPSGDPGRGILEIKRTDGTGTSGSRDTYTIYFSDKTTATFYVYNGKDGDMLRDTYDTNQNGIVDNAEKVNGHTVEIDVPHNAKFTDTTYTAGEGIFIDENNVIRNTQTSAEWGNIIGDITDQVDLKNALDTKITKDVNNLTYYELKINTGTAIAMTIDPTTYIMTAQLKNSAGTILSTQTIDLPLEAMVIGASYDNSTKELILTLKNGQTTKISIADLIDGLVPDTRTIAGINLKGNITKELLSETLGIHEKQDTLTAGENITIENNIISASGNPTGDTLPIGTVVDYDGNQVPTNWEEVPGGDIIDNLESNSAIDALSAKQGKLLNERLLNIEVGGTTTGDTLPIGSVVEWYSDVIPDNWLRLDGSAVSRTTYNELFALFGTTFGAGDGSTTFNLPDMRTRVPVGKTTTDSDFNTLGKTGGEKTHILTVAEMPEHNHAQSLLGDESSLPNPGSATYAWSVPPYYYNYSGSDLAQYAGENQPHNNLQPYITVHYIVKAKQAASVIAIVEDNLTSQNKLNALSANQGRILNDKIASVVSRTYSNNIMCTKFSDGTAIIAGTTNAVNFQEAGNQDVTVDLTPYQLISIFSAVSTVQVPYADNSYCDFVSYVYSKTKDSVKFQIWNKYPSTINFYINFTITGFWK